MSAKSGDANEKLARNPRQFKLLVLVLFVALLLGVKIYYDIVISDPLSDSMLRSSSAEEAKVQGDKYAALEKYAEAAKYYEEALKSEPDNTNYLRLAASTYIQLNQVEQAQSALDKAMEIDKTAPDNDVKLAENWYYISRLHRRLNRYEKTYEALTEAIKKAQTGKVSHNDLIRFETDLAINYIWRGKYAEAEALLEKIFTYSEQADQFNRASLYATRGLLYRRIGKNELALADFDQSLKLNIANLGLGHSRVARQRSNLGIVYRQLGQYGKSLTQFKTALASLIKIYGHNHQSVSSLYINIANILIMQGKYAQAQGYLEKAHAVNQSIGPRSKRVQMFTLITLGEVSMHRDMLENAMEYMLQAETICLELFGNEHHNMAYIWGLLGDLHMENNNLADARMFYHKSYEIYLKVYGPEHQTSKEGKSKLNQLDHQNH